MSKYTIIAMMILWCVSQIYAFNDIVGNKYQEDIESLSELKIVQWYPGNIFKPDQIITRAEMLKIVMWWADITLSTWWKECFSDISENEWYSNYICTAKSIWIIDWYSDGTFQPNKPVSNVEGIKIALKSFWIKPQEVSNWQEWYADYMNFVHQNNIFSRYSIYPESAMTRGMMAHLTIKIINQWTQPRTYNRKNISAWCSIPQPWTTPTSVTVNWVQRSIITDIGKNYNQSQPTKLIVAFHWRTNPNTLIRTYYKVDKASDGNVIIVYPSGLPEQWPTRSRQNPWDKPNTIRDYDLFDTIVEEFSENYCVNKDEIYVVGHSLGWWFTNTLACARWDIIRWIGSVWWSHTSKVTCTWPTSAIIMHHPEDNLASFAWWEAARDALLQQNQCDINITQSTGPEGWNCIQYTSCIGWSEVVWCPHNDNIENGRYYPHTRPDFAGKAIRDFFTNTL